MSQAPTPYTRQNNFVADATSNPSITVAGVAPDLDAEYEAIRTSVNQTISRLNEIQRDDGLLRSSVLDPAEYAAISAAVTGATDAAASAAAALTSQTNAAASAAIASTKATEASDSADDAASYKTSAQSSASAASTSELNAASYASTAIAQASSATGSASASAASAASAAANAVTASTKATEASASASAASADAATAATKASEASLSAANASASESAAAVSETNAAASALAAATSESNASSHEVSALNSATIATTKAHEANLSAGDAEAAKLTVLQAESVILPAANDANMRWEQFDARYLGAFGVDPMVDNNGDPLIVGATFFNEVLNELRVWDGTQWMAQYINANNTVTAFNSRQGVVTLLESDVAGVVTGAVSGVVDTNLTASRAVVSDASGKVVVSPVTSTELGYVSGVTSAIQTQINSANTAQSTHASSTSNPHSVTKAQVGLGNADNTSDADKPISTATQAALDTKISGVLTDAISGDGVTTAFTLSATTASPFVTVFIDGVYQHKATYTIAGTTLTFSAAPPSGAAIDVNIMQP